MIGATQISVVARLFTSSVIQEMARKGRSPTFVRLIRQSSLDRSVKSSARVRDVFEAAFDILKEKSNRNEYVYKAALTQKILLGVHSLQTASMMSEFRVGECKADVAILNGTATVYEIKSERDSLARLERQLRAYRRVFATINVIVGEKHLNEVLESVSDDTGVLVLHGRYRISEVRSASNRPELTDPIAIFESIRTEEAKRVLDRCGVEVPDVPNIEMHAALRKKFESVDPTDAHEGMVHVLKKSRNLLPLAELVNNLPRSLHAVALSCRLRRADHDRLLTAVNARMRDTAVWV